MPDTFLRLPEVKALTGLSRSTIYAQMAGGAFPLCIHIGARSVAWLQSEILVWQEQRIEQGRRTRVA